MSNGEPKPEDTQSAATFEQLVKLAELAIRRFETRRAYEWKILLGFWAAMLAVFSSAWNAPDVPGIWLIVAVAAFIVFWVTGVWVANHNDKERYELYLCKAEMLVGIKPTEVKDYPEKVMRSDFLKIAPKFFADWNVQFQIAATIAIATLVAIGNEKPQSELKSENERMQSIGWLDIQRNSEDTSSRERE